MGCNIFGGSNCRRESNPDRRPCWPTGQCRPPGGGGTCQGRSICVERGISPGSGSGRGPGRGVSPGPGRDYDRYCPSCRRGIPIFPRTY